jgi:hypothetical protein
MVMLVCLTFFIKRNTRNWYSGKDIDQGFSPFFHKRALKYFPISPVSTGIKCLLELPQYIICQREIGLGGVDWIQLAQDTDRWRAVVSAVMNLRVLAPRS